LIVIIGGATASGKTKLGAELAKSLNTSIISADSMQIYSGMDIGTAKVSDIELGVKQYCVDIISPFNNFSIVNYRDEAECAIKEIESQGKIPIVVGGTGYYISSLIYERKYGRPGDNSDELRCSIKEELIDEYNKNGIFKLWKELEQLDLKSALKIHPNNVKRVIRALEVIKTYGVKYSEQDNDMQYKRDNFLFYVLTSNNRIERTIRINDRVDRMLEEGLYNEINELLSYGVEFNMQSMQGIGYKEWQQYFENKSTWDKTIIQIKVDSKHYAKKQDTWFNNKYPYAKCIDVELGYAYLFDTISDDIRINKENGML
jgi:tRNA dimethylallyltransferase